MNVPLKWHGGKSYLARRIVELMPPHLHYVEPYCGGLSVLLAKACDGVSEVVNDLHSGLTNFWRVLQAPDQFKRFERIIPVPFSEAEWKRAHNAEPSGDPVTDAVAFFVNCRMSLAGRQDCFAPLSKTRVRRGMNEQASAWLSAVEGLAEVHARLKRVAILCRPGTEAIQSQDGPDTLYYCDPPYVSSSRAAPDVYKFEMSEADHAELLEVLNNVKGKAMVSGYDSDLYRSKLQHWNRHSFDLPNHAAGGRSKRRMEECLWLNY